MTRDTVRRERFIAEYLVDLDAGAAYQRAGYKCTPQSAAKSGWRMLARPGISEAIRQAQAKSLARIEVKADDMLAELLRVALSDVGDLFDEHNNLLDIKKMPLAARRAIASIEVDELFEGSGEERTQVGVTKKIKLWDKNTQLTNGLKHLRLLVDRVEHTGKVTLEQLVPKRKAPTP